MVRVERADRGDIPRFVDMEQEEGTREFIAPYGSDVHHERFTDPDTIYLRIVNDEELAGFFLLALDSDGRSIEFRRIVVASKGCGIGQNAIPVMEEYCRSSLGRIRIWLDVFEDNVRGRHVYEKLGYTRYGESELEGKRLLLYEKEI